jgi:REP element-mobilizing transposase RayT
MIKEGMPRQGRIDIIGGMYHIITRGINREKIFNDNDDREEFVRRLSVSLKETGNICYGWALMPNHFHLLVRRGKKSISDLMRKLLTGYAVYYNRKHKRRGYLFQNRYKSILCQEEGYLLELVRYIHLNPVRGGIVKNMKELSQYPWSGYAEIMGANKRGFQEVDEVLGRFGKSRNEACRKIAEYMEEGVKQGKRDDLTGGGLRRSAGGWGEILRMRAAKEYWRGDDRILGDGEFVEGILKESEQEFDRIEKSRRKGHSFEYLVEQVCKEYRIEKKDLRKKGRRNKIAEAKSVLVYMGKTELGISGKEISEKMGITQAAVSLLRGQGQKIVENKNINLIT